jgi:esterase/lipase
MRSIKFSAILLAIIIGIYFAGPSPARLVFNKTLPELSVEAAALEEYVSEKESKFDIKPDNEARIIWNDDSAKTKTEYAVVYLHGFSASHEEGAPTHMNFARKFGCNLFLSRLEEHGLKKENPLLNMTAENLYKSVQEAYAIGKQLGEKVIIMSTSTGGSLALKLAAENPEIAGLILYSPNIAINDNKAWMLNNPWGLQIAKMIKGDFVMAKDTTAIYKKYWYHQYRVESVVQLEEFLETGMRESTFQKIQQPVLMLYYYKNDEQQDPVVKVSAMKRMFQQLGTAANMKRAIALPEAGNHVIASPIKSKDIKTVEEETERFAVDILKMKKL